MTTLISIPSPLKALLLALGLPLFGFFPHLAGAQTYEERFHRYDTEDGLADYTITSILQDSRGFLWIGTQGGLSRFDGYGFETFAHVSGDTTSLSSNRVHALFEDTGGTLWVGTYGGGLNRFDPRYGRFQRYDLNAVLGIDPEKQRHVTVATITGDRYGHIWIGTNRGLLSFDPTVERFTSYRHDPGTIHSLSSDSVHTVLCDESGRIWLGTTGKGLNVLDPDTKRFRHYSFHPSDQRHNGANDIRALIEDHQGRLWLGLMDGALYRSDPERRTFEHIATPFEQTDTGVYSLYEDHQGIIWIGTANDGIWRYDPSRDAFNHLAHDPENPRSLSHNQVFTITEDRSGLIWVGTWSGLNKLTPLASVFKHFVPVSTGAQGRTEGSTAARALATHSIYEDTRGGLWIGTSGGGLLRFDPTTESYPTFPNEAALNEQLQSHIVAAVTEDRDGRLWIGTVGAGITLLDPQTGDTLRLRNDPKDPGSLNNDWVTTFREDRDGRMWVGTVYGLNRFDPDTGTFRAYVYAPGDTSGLRNNYISALYLDRAGTLWVGTADGGLHRYDRATASLTRFTEAPDAPPGLREGTIYSILEAGDGTLWFGTGNGLIRMDSTETHFTSYTIRDGLPHASVLCVLEDDNGLLWLGTNNGLSRLNPETGVFTNFTTSDGIQSSTFVAGACRKSRTGRLYIGGASGFNGFDPRAVQTNTHAPTVVLTDFTIHNKPYSLDQTPTALERIDLRHDENFFSLTFAAMDFTNPSQNRYRVRLDNLDADWVELGTRNSTTYTNVPPGRYILHIHGSNNNGVWSRHPVALTLEISPPFWKTWWFLTLIALCVAGMLLGLQQYRRRAHARLQNLRTRIAGQLHDNVSANLGSIMLKGEVLLAQTPDDAGRQKKLTEIVRLARDSALNIRETSWVVNTGHDRLDKLVTAMEDLTTDMLSDTVSISFAAPKPPPTHRISMDFRQHVYFLYKEILHNIVKHAQAAQVTVEITYPSNLLTIRVSDDGVGFDTRAAQSGNGLLLMQKRADEIHGTLTFRSCPAKGTTVVLEAPFHDRSLLVLPFALTHTFSRIRPRAAPPEA